MDLSRYVKNEYYSKVYTLSSTNIIYPIVLDRTINYREQAFQNAYFDLYPNHNLEYEETGKYYYLVEKGEE